MEFQINVQHTAENEAGALTFLTFIKDTYPTTVHDASVDSATLNCTTTVILTTLDDAVAAVQAFKAQFTITYKVVIT